MDTLARLSFWVPAGTFRQGLCFRLHGFEVELPPLRERREDIPELAGLRPPQSGPCRGGR